MDVRCEKCLTVYELDDSKVGDAGLTVKCQECGNLFKVRRRQDTTELVVPADDKAADTIETIRDIPRPPPAKPTPAPVPAPGPDTSRDLGEGFGNDSETAEPVTVARRQLPTAPVPTPPSSLASSLAGSPQSKPEDRGWMLRSATSREVVRFRELTTLQQWIVERKVTRQDEISRGGESWKELGGIAELASFFHVVEQAEAVAHASQPGLAVQRSAEEPSRGLPDLPTALLAQAPRRRTGTRDAVGGINPGGSFAGGDADVDDGYGRNPSVPRSNAAAMVLGGAVVAALIAGGGYWLHMRSQQRADSASNAGGAEAAELAQRGHAALLTDTDDGFRQAISALDRALELEGTTNAIASSAARADLGEAHVTWAAYLLEDAHKLETTGATGAQAAKTLRAEAQSHLERARRVLEEAGGADAAAGPIARAFGDLLRVEGGPAAAASKYLQRAAQKGVDDPELAYALGELALREGKAPEAITHLGEASHSGLVRAQYRLAVMAKDAGKADELRQACDTLAKIAPKHDRAHALCEPATPSAPDAGAVPARADAGVAVVATAKPVGTDPGLEPVPLPKTREPGLAPTLDYKSLVREADRLSENGHSREARKIYERALEADPRGVAALTGLGYCDLDAERFMQAVDRFNAALAVDPACGDAVVGLAESYKVRGQTQRAIDQYKKYLAAHPDGPKASMAKKNLRDLEPKAAKEAAGNDPSDPTKEKPKREDSALPRPPPDDAPPP